MLLPYLCCVVGVCRVQVGATLLAVALVAAMGLAAGAFGVSVMRGGLEEGAVVDWGLTVGVLCAAQLGVNLLHMLLAPAAGVGDPRGYGEWTGVVGAR